jgi:hypothetical protein
MGAEMVIKGGEIMVDKRPAAAHKPAARRRAG